MPTQISGNSTRKVPDTVLLERVAISFGCQHGLLLTRSVELVRYYNALYWIVVPPHGLEPRTY